MSITGQAMRRAGGQPTPAGQQDGPPWLASTREGTRTKNPFRQHRRIWIAILVACAVAVASVFTVLSVIASPARPSRSRQVILGSDIGASSSAAASQTLAAQLAAPASPSPGLIETFTPTTKVVGGAAAAAVERAFATAVSLHWELGAPPVVNGAPVHPSASLLSSMLSADTARIQSVYEPRAAAYEMKGLNTSIGMQGDGFVVLGGGVSHIVYSSVEVRGNHASASAVVTPWSEFKVSSDGNIARPSGDTDVSMTLDRVGGNWLVATMDLSMPPGALSP